MIKRPTVTPLSEPAHTIKLRCGECGWESFIASTSGSNVVCCAWCGWSDLEISQVEVTGAFQKIHCQKHGEITVVISSQGIHENDFGEVLWCPFCP